MKRMIIGLFLAASVAGAAAPAFAVHEYTNCSEASSSQLAACVIGQSKRGDGGN